MSHMIQLSYVLLLFWLQLANHVHAAPVIEKQDTHQNVVDTVKKNDLLEGDMKIDQTVLNIVSNTTTKRSATTDKVKRWPGGIVPYVISNQLSKYMQSLIEQAIAELHTSTCIQFRKRTYEHDYVEFIKGYQCWSYVGRKQGKQQISLGTGCEAKGTALHEMVHTLGFFHTSSRTDRDYYVIVYDNHIQSGEAHNFKKYSHGDIDRLNSPYDITSIMHLSRDAFSKYPNLNTIEARAGASIKLGKTGKLSPVDKYQINTLYKCASTTASSSCLSELGLQKPNVIRDKAMRASSYLRFHSPGQARLHQTPSSQGYGAWCPYYYTSTSAWLEIDLGQLVRITGIATQGYSDPFGSDLYTPNYDLKYKKYKWQSYWYHYTSTCSAYKSAQGLPGNWDGYSVQYNALTPTINARVVRLYPNRSTNKMRPCFRVEFYGCKI